MARIMITTDTDDGRTPVVLLEERVLPAHFESDHYSAQLVERVGWAIVDADARGVDAKGDVASAQR
jgi:hypothetical protein